MRYSYIEPVRLWLLLGVAALAAMYVVLQRRRSKYAVRFTNIAFRPSATVLDPYKEFVRATLEQHPRLRATRLLQMIQGRGYGGSVWPLRRFVRQVRPVASHEAFFRLSVLPGEQGQSSGD